MKPALLLPIAVALILAGSAISWWRIPAASNRGQQVAVGLLMMEHCEDAKGQRACTFTDDNSGAQLASARHWTFLVGLVAAALLIALRAAPIGSRLRGQVAAASVIASAGALVLGLGVLSVIVYVGIELQVGYPGLGGMLFVAGSILGLRTSRLLVAAESA